MRLLGNAILLGTSRSHRDPPEPEAPQQCADRSLGQLDPIALLDHMREVDPPPAHHAMLGQIRAGADQFGHLSFLLRGEPGLGSRSGSIVQPFQAFAVIAVNPIVAASLRDLPSSTSAKASIRRAASASSVRLAAARSSPAVWSFRVIATAATMLASSPNQEGKGIMPAQNSKSPTSQNYMPLV